LNYLFTGSKYTPPVFFSIQTMRKNTDLSMTRGQLIVPSLMFAGLHMLVSD